MFSVKESVLKALGGIPRGGRYPHIEVEPPRRGRAAAVRLHGELARRARERDVRLLAGALPVRDGLVLSWVLAMQATTAEATRNHAAQNGPAHNGPAHNGHGQNRPAQNGPSQHGPSQNREEAA